MQFFPKCSHEEPSGTPVWRLYLQALLSCWVLFRIQGQGHDRYRWHEDRAEKAEEKGVVCSEDVVNPVSEAAKKGRGSILLISKVSTAHNWDGKKQIILNSMTGTKQSMFLLPVCQNPKKDE